MRVNILPILFFLALCIFIYTRNKENNCTKFNQESKSIIENKTVNLMQSCGINSGICVNSALLFKEEQIELLEHDLKELGCK